MRERIAVGLSVAAVALVVILSTVFAVRQNPGLEAAPAHPEVAADGEPVHSAKQPATGVALEGPESLAQPADSVRGRLVFRQQGCERCHSVAGEGSRRYPLDGVGLARTREQLLAWTVAEESVADSLSPSAARAKRRYQELPQADLDALLEYMSRLVEPGP